MCQVFLCIRFWRWQIQVLKVWFQSKVNSVSRAWRTVNSFSSAFERNSWIIISNFLAHKILEMPDHSSSESSISVKMWLLSWKHDALEIQFEEFFLPVTKFSRCQFKKPRHNREEPLPKVLLEKKIGTCRTTRKPNCICNVTHKWEDVCNFFVRL